MKQTAVEWLEEFLKDRYTLMDSEAIFQHAKEMEKEQIERAYHQGVVNELSIYCTPDPSTYYKKTYGDE
jgi:hypothetical protein